MLPCISVIVTTHNRSSLLGETLESVFAQSMTDYEVVVVDDGSTDNTAIMLRPLIEQGRIRYVYQSSQGISAARNLGYSMAKGEYIAFLDDDDLFIEHKLQLQAAFLDENPKIECVSGARQCFGHHDALIYAPEPCVGFRHLFRGNIVGTVGQALIRKTALDELTDGEDGRTGPYDVSLRACEDWDVWFRLAYRQNLHCNDQVVLMYRTHDSSISQDLALMLDTVITVIDRQLLLLNNQDRPECRKAAAQSIFWNFVRPLLIRSLSGFKSGKFRQALMDIHALRRYALSVAGQPDLYIEAGKFAAKRALRLDGRQ